MALKYLLQSTLKGLTSCKNVCTLQNIPQTYPWLPCTSLWFGTKSKSSDPDIARPKLFKNPYICFAKEQIPLARQSSPEKKIPEITRIVAEKWRSLSDQEKQPYIEESERSREQYMKEWGALSDKEQEIVRAERLHALKKKKERRNLVQRRKLSLSLGKPKQPAPPFARFIMSDKPPALSLKEHMQNKKEAWKSLTEEEKKRMEDDYKEDVNVYKTKLLEWETMMLKRGYPELIRHSSLKQLTPSDLLPEAKAKKKSKSKTGPKGDKHESQEKSKEKGGRGKAKKTSVDEDPSWMREE